MAPTRLSKDAIIVLKWLVESWENGACAFRFGYRLKGLADNSKTLRRVGILERAGYIVLVNETYNSYHVTIAGIARHDIERFRAAERLSQED